MKRLTKKLSKTIQNKYSLGSYSYYDFADTKDTKRLLNKLGELEDVLEKYGIKNLEEYISALIEARNLAIRERNTTFRKYIKETIKTEELETELDELEQKAIMTNFNIGDYFIEYWDTEPTIYQYKGNKHFECLNKAQGYHCDYIILGALLLGEDFIKKISKKEAKQKLAEIKGEKDE